MNKRNFGKRVRITAYVEESMYEALKAIAQPEEDEAWESRIARKAFALFLEKHGTKAPAQVTKKSRPTGKIIDGPQHSKDALR